MFQKTNKNREKVIKTNKSKTWIGNKFKLHYHKHINQSHQNILKRLINIHSYKNKARKI